ncbi:hypothetical protein PISMIDRAFT_25096 [Pisolithus microcarpus 441]|uniref:Uncharacterized protein n=1 Tax=Pisolithus microcarpus 441 TaxID=765257 RepID=A0A0C9XW05_9AGAM|nr:hypothetical protein PISMIDRAFT_25096 [Pisolithus microcarpus 441]
MASSDPEYDNPAEVHVPHPSQGHSTPRLLSQYPSPTNVTVQKSPSSTTEPESDDTLLPSTTEPESDAPLRQQTPRPSVPAQHASPGSTTEPESDDPLLPALTRVEHGSSGSTTKAESDALPSEQTPHLPDSEKISTKHLPSFKSIFATPSPPPSGSLYWKYVTPEEDAKWYDRTGEDSTFNVIRRWKRELEGLE